MIKQADKYGWKQNDLQILADENIFTKHAPGKHNQQSHAGGRGSAGKSYENLQDYLSEVVPKVNTLAWEQNLMTQTYSQDTDPSYNGYIESYVGVEGLAINRKLREEEEQDADDADLISGLSGAIRDTASITEPITVYRGIKKSDQTDAVFSELGIGDTFQDSGFISTSLNSYVAGQMAGSRNSPINQGILMKITVPAGSKGIYPNSFLKGLNEFGQEAEFLLPIDTKLRLNNKLGKVWEMEVVNG